MLCPNCETENRDTAKFCDECGFPLVEANQEPVEPDDAVETALNNDDSEAPDTADVQVSDDAADDEGDAQDAPADEPQDIDAQEADGEEPADLAAQGSLDDADVVDDADAVDDAVADEEADLDVQPTQTIEDLGERGYSERYGADLDTFNRDATEVIRPELIGFDTMSDDMGHWHDGGTMEMPRVEGEEAQKGKVYSASSTVEKKKHGKLVALIVVAIAIIAAIAAFGSYQAGIWGGKPVPDVNGMIEADARSVLADEGFAVRVEQIKSDDTEGVVLIMDPPGGTRIDEGAEVVINVATARVIPDIEGKSEDDAKAALAEEGFENIKTKKKSSDKKKGTVIGIEPKKGEKALSTTEVTLTIAEPYTVPDVANKSLDAAITAIEKAGLGYEVVYYSTDDYADGAIIGTEPAAGTEVKKGSYVVIEVAQPRGAELESLAASALSPGTTIERNGKSYTIESVDAVSYSGNNQVQYTVTAREYGTLFGITLSNEVAEQINGTVEFNDNNEIVQIL